MRRKTFHSKTAVGIFLEFSAHCLPLTQALFSEGDSSPSPPISPQKWKNQFDSNASFRLGLSQMQPEMDTTTMIQSQSVQAGWTLKPPAQKEGMIWKQEGHIKLILGQRYRKKKRPISKTQNYKIPKCLPDQGATVIFP